MKNTKPNTKPINSLAMEPSDRLIAHISETVNLSALDITSIIGKFKVKELKKKEILLYKGDVSVHMRFIAKGCLKSYHIDEDGQEHILQFGVENWWINDLYSYLTQTPAKYFVQAVEASTVLQIHKDALEELFKESPSIERFFRLKIQKAYVAQQDRIIHRMSQTAEERYVEFRAEYRHIEQKVPQYMIASYLGITPEFLSAVRKKLIAE